MCDGWHCLSTNRMSVFITADEYLILIGCIAKLWRQWACSMWVKEYDRPSCLFEPVLEHWRMCRHGIAFPVSWAHLCRAANKQSHCSMGRNGFQSGTAGGDDTGFHFWSSSLQCFQHMSAPLFHWPQLGQHLSLCRNISLPLSMGNTIQSWGRKKFTIINAGKVNLSGEDFIGGC